MKQRHTFAAILAVCAIIGLAFWPDANAQTSYKAPLLAKSGTSTDKGNTNSYFVFPKGAGVPHVTFHNTTSDKAGSVLKFYQVDAVWVVDTATNSSANTYINGSGAFTANSVAVFWDASADTYQRISVLSTNAGGFITTEETITASALGDIVYQVSAAGQIPVAAATVEDIAEPIYAGQKGLPLLVEIDGTSACQINLITGHYK